MKYIRNFLSHHRYFYLVFMFIPLQIWFEHSEKYLVPKYMTQIWIDYKIPFIPVFVIPYILWFAFVPFGFIYIGLHSKKDFYKFFILIFGGMTVANIIFNLFPNAQGLRPVITSTDPFSLMVKYIYYMDTPTDVFPSLHIINTLAVNAALQHSQAFSEKKYRKVSAHVFTLLVCLSTVFIKQHSILDIISAFAVSALFYIPLYLIPLVLKHHKRTVRINNNIHIRETIAEKYVENNIVEYERHIL